MTGRGEMMAVDYPQIVQMVALPIVALWLGAKMAENKTYREKIWERKAEAYGTILDAIDTMARQMTYWTRDVERSIERTLDETTAAHQQFRTASRGLASTLARESWLLPMPVQAEIDRLHTELNRDFNDYHESVDNGAFEARKALDTIRSLARIDMGSDKLYRRLRL